MKYQKIISIGIILHASVFAECFPESSYKIPTSEKSSHFLGGVGGLSELEYHQAIDQFEKLWAPVVAQKYNRTLIIKRDWENEKVNAHATRDDANNPVIVVNGALARHSQITRDGLLLMMCHELGHHFGGAPKQFRGTSTLRSWSSVEGQADYFASSKCMPKFFENYSEKSLSQLPEEASVKIALICQKPNCERIVAAALSVGKVMASLKQNSNPPVIDKSDSTKVAGTLQSHANPQCRFDTFVAGYNCEEDHNSDFDNEDYAVGACVNEDLSSRPNCWFTSQSY